MSTRARRVNSKSFESSGLIWMSAEFDWSPNPTHLGQVHFRFGFGFRLSSEIDFAWLISIVKRLACVGATFIPKIGSTVFSFSIYYSVNLCSSTPNPSYSISPPNWCIWGLLLHISNPSQVVSLNISPMEATLSVMQIQFLFHIENTCPSINVNIFISVILVFLNK